jgi:hypothetical protein
MRALPFGLMLFLSGCLNSANQAIDPCFDQAWYGDARNREIQSREEYLKWVDSFYDGSVIVPGWTRRQQELCASLPPLEASIAESGLVTLGRLVASEWAKDNRLRRVDSNLLQLMVGILVEAKEKGRLIPVLDALVEDVRSLLAGRRDPRSITAERYEPLG